jgi:FdhE protein
MVATPWQRRIQRAQDLIAQHPFAAEMLGFYICMARFQEGVYRRCRSAFQDRATSDSLRRDLTAQELAELESSFEAFLVVVDNCGPEKLAEVARDLKAKGPDSWSRLLASAWTTAPSDAEGYLAFAHLQPFAEFLRASATVEPRQLSYALCPFCDRKPGLGVLRQKGEGAARSMVCGFCLAEWEFRRIVCPGCGEENDKKLPVYTAEDWDCIRVECCDTCKTYIKTVDLTKNGRAEPLVDEMATPHLDLWARDHGYTKLQSNLLGM